MSKDKVNHSQKTISKKVVMIKCEYPEVFRQMLEASLNDSSLKLIAPPSQMRHEMCAFFIREEKQ